MNWFGTRSVCLLAKDRAILFNCLAVFNVGKSGFVKLDAGFGRPFLGYSFPNFCGVICFYEIKLEVEVGFCMFFVLYMFSKQISYESNWQTASGRSRTGRRTGRQLQSGATDHMITSSFSLTKCSTGFYEIVHV